jgi:HD-GYP domain-containing protein (c-di-GMP phosphodiesterase class II)
MQSSYYRAIGIECIDPACFPDVALFIRSGGNYVLYKPHERKFTNDDFVRLHRNSVEFLYVRSGDIEVISDYVENNLSQILGRDDLSSFAKGKILYQSSANYVTEIFETPEKALNVERCRNLVRQIMQFVTFDKCALQSLQSIISHNFYIYTHSVQVTALSLLMHAEIFQLSRDELLDVGIGALFHDFGMIFISNEILNKPDALSEVEYYKVKQHAQKGYEFFLEMRVFSDISLSIIRHHHEKFDGSGYPAMLQGNSIPRSAQVTGLCDMFSALTSDRVYRNRVTTGERALQLMQEESEGAFNPDLLRSFAEIIRELNYPVTD